MPLSFSPAHCSQQLAPSRRFIGAVSTDALPPSMASQAEDCHVFAGEWEYVDGAAVRLTLDEEGNGHDDWKDGRFETHSLIDHTWHGMWVYRRRVTKRVDLQSSSRQIFQKGRGAGGSAASEPTIHPRKGGTFHLSKKTALMNQSDTSPVSCEASHAIADDRQGASRKECQAIYSPSPNTP